MGGHIELEQGLSGFIDGSWCPKATQSTSIPAPVYCEYILHLWQVAFWIASLFLMPMWHGPKLSNNWLWRTTVGLKKVAVWKVMQHQVHSLHSLPAYYWVQFCIQKMIILLGDWIFSRQCIQPNLPVKMSLKTCFLDKNWRRYSCFIICIYCFYPAFPIVHPVK